MTRTLCCGVAMAFVVTAGTAQAGLFGFSTHKSGCCETDCCPQDCCPEDCCPEPECCPDDCCPDDCVSTGCGKKKCGLLKRLFSCFKKKRHADCCEVGCCNEGCCDDDCTPVTYPVKRSVAQPTTAPAAAVPASPAPAPAEVAPAPPEDAAPAAEDGEAYFPSRLRNSTTRTHRAANPFQVAG